MKTISNRFIGLWKSGYLYVIIACFMYFIWFISNNVGVLDWVKEIAYFEYFKTSFNDYHTLPYFWWNILEEVAWRPPITGTSAIIANPETALFSPFTPLLYLFSAQVYIKLYIIIQFLIGVFGLFALKRKLNWNNSQFRNYAALFLFSPIALQHIAVGYFTWYNFYYFPWLLYFMAEKQAIKGIIGSAAVLGLIILQGGIYIVQYFGLFWLIYEIFHILFEKDYKRIYRIIFIPALMILLSLVRIASSAIVYSNYARPYFDIDGYDIPFFLFYALVPTVTIPPLDLWFHTDYLGWALTPHDSGLFWGLTIVMLIIVTFKYKKIVKNASANKQNGINYHAIFIAASVLFIISFYRIWYVTMRGLEILNLPLLETIKNHGIRFIMGAYFGYAVLLANYIPSIWKEMDIFIRTKVWSILKRILLIVGYSIFLGSGVCFVILGAFKQLITNRFANVITAAYNNTGHYWLKQRMEGIHENSLEFYFYRFDLAYSSIFHWVFVIFTVSLLFFILTYLLNKNSNRFASLIQRFPHLKYELLLVIPLAFSTAMWMNLATSVPFDEFPIRKVLPPKVVVKQESEDYLPHMEVTPKNLLIKPDIESKVKGYIFPQIPATDHKYFEVTSKNAILFNKNGQLMLKPLDNEPIEMQFRTDSVWKALIITIVSWSMVIGLMLTQLVAKRKRSKEYNLYGQ
ncbi:MAG: hypothetical protein KAS35_00275 [Candidatus Marinimicrobia bacterium]|nr:hypothetical protein [Candidatus Neomarinimicrobiota bacterium]